MSTARRLNADITSAPPPPGYILDAKGRWVPERSRSEVDLLRDQTVRALVASAQSASAQIGALKAQLFADLSAHVQLVAETHGVRLTGRGGSVILISLDGCQRVERTVAPRMRVGVDVLAAEALINEMVEELTAGVDPNLRALVQGMFARDAAGNIAPSRLLDFIRLELPDPRWKRAQAAVRQAIESDGESIYFRAYTRPDPTQPWEQVPLDFSRVPYATGAAR